MQKFDTQKFMGFWKVLGSI